MRRLRVHRRHTPPNWININQSKMGGQHRSKAAHWHALDLLRSSYSAYLKHDIRLQPHQPPTTQPGGWGAFLNRNCARARFAPQSAESATDVLWGSGAAPCRHTFRMILSKERRMTRRQTRHPIGTQDHAKPIVLRIIIEFPLNTC